MNRVKGLREQIPGYRTVTGREGQRRNQARSIVTAAHAAGVAGGAGGGEVLCKVRDCPTAMLCPELTQNNMDCELSLDRDHLNCLPIHPQPPVSKWPAAPCCPELAGSRLAPRFAGCQWVCLLRGEQELTRSNLPFWELLGLPPASHFGGTLSSGFGPTRRPATERELRAGLLQDLRPGAGPEGSWGTGRWVAGVCAGPARGDVPETGHRAGGQGGRPGHSDPGCRAHPHISIARPPGSAGHRWAFQDGMAPGSRLQAESAGRGNRRDEGHERESVSTWAFWEASPCPQQFPEQHLLLTGPCVCTALLGPRGSCAQKPRCCLPGKGSLPFALNHRTVVPM